MPLAIRLSALAMIAFAPHSAFALDVAAKSAISASMRADSARGEIFREMGRRIPGRTPGFVGDAVQTADGYYIGSVDEVYTGGHGARVLVVGIAHEARGYYGIAADTLYVRLPGSEAMSDGTVRLPMGLAEVARRF